MPEHPIKFILKTRPTRAAFRLSHEPAEPQAAAAAAAGGAQRPVHRAALHLFHPTEPFALTVVHSLMMPTVVNIYFRD